MQSNIAFVFPGQGAQYVGMGAEYAEQFPIVKDVFAQADEALGTSLSTLCFDGPESELQKTENTQPAILTVSYALYTLLRSELNLQPQFMAGHSLGEYSALAAAGALPFDQAIRIVRTRGRLMEQAVPAGAGGMAAIIGLDHDAVQALCADVPEELGVAEPATLNAPGQTVVAGTQQALEDVIERAKQAGARRAVPLKVSGPFHSSLLKRAGDQLLPVLKEANWQAPNVPIVANVTARPVQQIDYIQQHLVNQVQMAVRWEESVRYMIDQGVHTFLEIGPGKVLAGLIRRIDRSAKVLTMNSVADWQEVLAWAKGDDII